MPVDGVGLSAGGVCVYLPLPNGDVLMSVLSVYKTTCRCCDVIETALITSFTATANFFALARIANQAANAASTGDHEKAKAMILKI